MHTLTRRHVLATLSGSAVMLCPAVMNAAIAEVPWGDIETTTPVGQASTLTLDAGPAEVDVSTLQPGEVAVIARPTTDPNYTNTGMMQYVGVLRRTGEQMTYAEANDAPGTTQDPRYLVVDLLCPHRGKAIGITGDAAFPFACTDRGSRHSSDFDASGKGVAGASAGDPMIIPSYKINVKGDGTAVVSLA